MSGESRADDASLDRPISTVMVVDYNRVGSTCSDAAGDCRMQMLPMIVMMTMLLVISTNKTSKKFPDFP
jgi:hypothetical protein